GGRYLGHERAAQQPGGSGGLAAACLRRAQRAGAGGEKHPGRRRAGILVILVAPRLRDPERAALAGGGAPGQYARPAAAAADAGLLRAREPALEAAQCAALAADARRGRLPRGPARGAGLGAALLRHALEADRRRARAIESIVVALAQLRDAGNLGGPGGGAGVQVAPRAWCGMNCAGWGARDEGALLGARGVRGGRGPGDSRARRRGLRHVRVPALPRRAVAAVLRRGEPRR